MHAYIASARRAFLLATIALVAACSSNDSTAPADGPDQVPPTDTIPTPSPAVASIDVSGDLEVVATYMGWLQAVPRRADGSPANVTVTWRSSDASVIEVDAVGGMIGRKVGSAEISASVGNVVVRRTVTVVPRLATSMQVTPFTWELQRGDVASIGVVVLDQKRQYLADAPIAYSVSDPSIVEVVGSELRPLKAGKVTVTITSGGLVATTPLTVAAASVYPLKEVNMKALPAVAFQSQEYLPHGRVVRQLIITEGKLTLSNSSDRFTQRLVVEEWEETHFNGNVIRTKLAQNESFSRGSYTIDASGQAAMRPDDSDAIYGRLTGTRGIELMSSEGGTSLVYHYWR